MLAFASSQKIDMRVPIYVTSLWIVGSKSVCAELWARYELIDTTDNMKTVLGFLQPSRRVLNWKPDITKKRLFAEKVRNKKDEPWSR